MRTKQETKSLSKIDSILLSIQSIKLKEKLVFYRLLSTMVNAWMGLLKSVSVLEKQEKRPLMKHILWRFMIELKSWKNLSDCLELFPSSFAEAEIWIIKSWEKTWKLNTVLVDLADQVEKVASMNWKLKSAMMYPAFIMLVVLIVVFVMMTVVVPKLLEIFPDKDNLPASTKALMSVSDFFTNNWIFMIVGFIAFIFAVKIWKKTPSWKYLFDSLLFRVPILWGVTQKIILSKFSRVFSWLISSWVSIVESLNITSEAVWNEVYRQRLILLSEDVKWGIKIWESIDWDALFPDMMVQMIQVWEETAKLDQTIVKIAEFYDEQVDNTISMLNKLLEPFIIVFLAVVVGFIALAIMQPIMELADSVSG